MGVVGSNLTGHRGLGSSRPGFGAGKGGRTWVHVQFLSILYGSWLLGGD